MNFLCTFLEKTGTILKTCTYILIITAISFLIPDIKEFLFPPQVCTACTSFDRDPEVQNTSDVEVEEVESEEDSGFEKIDLYEEKIITQRNEIFETEYRTNVPSNVNPIPRMEIVEIEKTCAAQPTYFGQQGDFNQLKKNSIPAAVCSNSQNVVDWIFPFLKKEQ